MADIITFIGDDVGNEGDLSVAANYDPVGVPVATDHLHFDRRSSDVLVNFDEFAAVALGSIHFHADWTNQVVTTDPDVYLEFGGGRVSIGEDDGASPSAGSPRLKVSLAGESEIHVLRTSAASTDDNMPPVRVKMAHAGAILYVRDGAVGVGIDAADEAGISLGTVDVAEGANVTVGEVVTLGNYHQSGGEGRLRCGVTVTVKVKAGTLTTEGLGTLGAVTQDGGTVFPNSVGTVTSWTLNDGTCDTLQSNASRTITAFNHNGGQLKRDSTVVAIGTLVEAGRVSSSVSAA